MTEEANQVSADGRSALRRAWERRTIQPLGLEGNFLARGTTVFSWVDRLLILFGRDVVTVVTTEAEPDAAMYRLLDTLKIEVGTNPRRYRR